MPSLVYQACLENLAKNNIDFEADTFYGMLVTDAYTPNKDTHTHRDDVTNEVANGNGYTTGGAALTPTVTNDTTNDRLDVSFSNPSWPTSTITARAMVIYKNRGGASSADELVAYVDFGSNVASTGGTFNVTFSSPLRFDNSGA